MDYLHIIAGIRGEREYEMKIWEEYMVWRNLERHMNENVLGYKGYVECIANDRLV